MKAVEVGNAKIIKLLLDARADPAIKNSRSRTALEYARNFSTRQLIQDKLKVAYQYYNAES